MSHRDLKLNADLLRIAFQWLLRGVDWSPVAWRNDCTWTPSLLTVTALLWAWSDERTLKERFVHARKIACTLFPLQYQVAESYQAFTKILVRWTSVLLQQLHQKLRERMQQEFTDCWLLYGLLVFGVDGSRIELPRTLAHERAWSAKRRKSKRRPRKHKSRASVKKAQTPQAWLTTMWHAGTSLPWDWRIGPCDSSERGHWMQMLPSLPDGALVAADAGFVGYQYSRAVIESGRHVLLRIGSNVRLIRKLGYAKENGQTVYLWTDRAAKNKQAPLVLRLVIIHTGKQPVYLLTSILSPSRLTDRQVGELYARRWGIELYYRRFKQTFGRRKLRSASPDAARIELEWSLTGLWTMSLYALVQIRKQGLAPQRLSSASMLLVYRRMLRDHLHPVEPGQTLCQQLRLAVIDSYERAEKSSRDYPRKKREAPPGKPKIVLATRIQTQIAKALHAA